MAASAACTAPYNLVGQPTTSLPLHQNDDGLPIGVQFADAAHRGNVLLRLTAQLERAAPWSDRHPLTAPGAA
ncbi:amidase family protein [Amycolatopsis sp. PS_44_ISF1]|uniref:amidase family protein n=1 Tax=Amycolatopsis sp. PS_44_ISF1 TaxID=2974917 RepID=UPI0028DE567A|nr:amidase family protein [Amycolatopsis sp. PS_44_ISF1]MDT8913724.1 amidase family protein [Amycolatopsis sp. PS_44_ISF1]